jgi:hypothetical protein
MKMVGKPHEKEQFRRHRRENNMKMDLLELCEDVNWQGFPVPQQQRAF